MMKKMLAIMCAMAIVVPAIAGTVDGQNYEVFVNIEVAPEVSMWAGHENVSLLMNGQDGNNSATFESTISHINNVAADISANVTGTLPAPIVPGGGINFFLFPNQNEAGAVAAITANAYTPAGAAAWNYGSLGTPATVLSVPLSTSISNVPMVYASSAPGEIPLPDTFNLTVTWTISATP